MLKLPKELRSDAVEIARQKRKVNKKKLIARHKAKKRVAKPAAKKVVQDKMQIMQFP